ncbi:DNA-3-methyladenine glycosylase family protein [Streptomyces stelliscabiei]|uniref:3-methyladenine DNA glycosylase/8-oxoguanine DNA glycosylase n=1 Tax=Streptomyces stelliscabiei TaxID=146820 RepID=A0A8I0TQB7_9ACTN|nr:3-methyladenine DNA glycosylase [Streptomyces stelliscabiei]KND44334.1 3-methyladenine DNA glycosylase [Streptomyces stelliscabiei]MBE1597770.1 3-methyladenine DNA glycosylase/8-oxoguanine DNA glycosylase [Streptomyces stelliscabiei]MDX2515268.1 DNA-3-methyladenine glycosylase 2 family protein [Streptomyces stelliscabiei]MDX2551899.1 DNA-3-methyladenine glycosylase 2 family protein [Streptomyces stelliscabiei]MDX2609733.1 DNA-3-methyladenine glycosylase 2 family protein [Streptomyces stelli
MAGRFPQRPTRTTVRGGHVVVPGGVPRQAVAAGKRRTWVPEGPLDLGLVLGPLRRGPQDPTFRAVPDGSVWRTSRTPVGAGTLRVAVRGGAVEAEAWGPGAEWLLDRVPSLLGASDEPDAFVPRHRVVAMAWRRRPGLRLTRTGLVLESLIPSVLEQKVTTDEAYRAWRSLVRKFGEPAPGPVPPGMFVMPSVREWALIPSWEWHRAGVDDKRASTILRAVRVAGRLEEAVGMSPVEARARWELVPGIGPWTSAETVQRSHGAADEVTVGDLHLPGIVGFVLAGDRDADDSVMLSLLEPYAGQRHRAARLILLSGRGPARRAPRMPRGDIGRL